MNRRFRHISTSTLKAMSTALARCEVRALRRFRLDVERELLARELESMAAEAGGYPCIAPEGWQ